MQGLLSPQEFVQNWRNTKLNERKIYQPHFIDVCRMVGYEPPGNKGHDKQGNLFSFEYGTRKTGGGLGFADVYLQRHFAMEYKSPNENKSHLNEAYNQLLQYHENLENPPLLIVSDINHWKIHTKWQNTITKVYEFEHEAIADDPEVQKIIRYAFFEPERLNPKHKTEDVTKSAAEHFRVIAENMRSWEAEPARIASLLTKVVFCLFAEDIGLLPYGLSRENGIFSEIIKQTRHDSRRFVTYTEQLFKAMAEGGNVLTIDIPYFNGALFDDVQVEELSLEAMTELEKASELNWESVEPSIFGTLFERSLDPAKRAQLGAHYTSRDDIQLIVQPVLMRPLEREWERIKAEAAPIWDEYERTQTISKKRINQLSDQLKQLRDEMLQQIRSVRVLDPACGSGNFLYIALQNLMTFEKQVITHEFFQDFRDAHPQVHPRQMYGIEKDEIAHALTSIVVWIGWLQWRLHNGYRMTLPEPILEDLSSSIVCGDAILSYDSDGKPIEPEWAAVDVIVGNPPFLGGSRILGELGEVYQHDVWKVYQQRVPGFADLVCYWYEKARKQIEAGKAKRAGLLATNSIRGGVNRQVLERIKQSGDIFMAWSDREWLLEGAAVRVSIVGFDSGSEQGKILDGQAVTTINPDLTSQVDITIARQLHANLGICFIGTKKAGAFDIDHSIAGQILRDVNLSGRDNADVLTPWINGTAIVQNDSRKWIINFGEMPEADASLYVAPFEHVRMNVYPERQKNNERRAREMWWWHRRPAMEMMEAKKHLTRFIATPRVSKHRLFRWYPSDVTPDDGVYIFARDDDYFFGVLHSRLHEVWSLRMGTWLGKGNDPRYTPTTTFETFPFPWSPSAEDTSAASYQAIATTAKQLHEERDTWLNSEGLSKKAQAERTLTNLYNALNVWRGKEAIRTVTAAADFAPRLDELHIALDRAVCDAYGWSHEVLNDEEEILWRLLTLNLERAGQR